MKLTGRLLLVLAVVAATSFVLATPASAAATIVLGPGQSIQL